MNSKEKQAVEMMEIDQADFHIPHRLDDGEEPILRLTTQETYSNNRSHLAHGLVPPTFHLETVAVPARE